LEEAAESAHRASELRNPRTLRLCSEQAEASRSVEAVICRQGGETTRGKIKEHTVGNNQEDSLYRNQVIP